MSAARKYYQETRDRAVTMYQGRRRDFPAESALQARRRVGELLDVKPETLGAGSSGSRSCRPAAGRAQSVEARIKQLEREDASPTTVESQPATTSTSTTSSSTTTTTTTSPPQTTTTTIGCSQLASCP